MQLITQCNGLRSYPPIRGNQGDDNPNVPAQVFTGPHGGRPTQQVRPSDTQRQACLLSSSKSWFHLSGRGHTLPKMLTKMRPICLPGPQDDLLPWQHSSANSPHWLGNYLRGGFHTICAIHEGQVCIKQFPSLRRLCWLTQVSRGMHPETEDKRDTVHWIRKIKWQTKKHVSTNVENVYSSHAMYTTTCCGMGCTSTRIQILALEGTINYYYYTWWILLHQVILLSLYWQKTKKKKKTTVPFLSVWICPSVAFSDLVSLPPVG